MQKEVNERVKDLVTVVLLLAVGVGGFLFINPKGAAITEGPGGLSWRSLPFIYSGLLIGLTLVYGLTSAYGLWRAVRNGEDGETGEAASPELRDEGDRKAARTADLRRVAVVVCLAAYALSLPMFGFIITTPVLLLVLFYAFGRTRLSHNLTLAIVGGAVLSLLFIGLLKLPLRGAVWDPATPSVSQLFRTLGL